jgi:hypothetical protein
VQLHVVQSPLDAEHVENLHTKHAVEEYKDAFRREIAAAVARVRIAGAWVACATSQSHGTEQSSPLRSSDRVCGDEIDAVLHRHDVCSHPMLMVVQVKKCCGVHLFAVGQMNCTSSIISSAEVALKESGGLSHITESYDWESEREYGVLNQWKRV